MAEWNLPFAPPQFYAEEAAAPRREPVVIQELLCTYCQLPIVVGDLCLHMTPGVSGFGAKSGRPMVIEDPDDNGDEEASLHYGCVIDYVLNNDPGDEEPQFCAACDAQLNGRSG
jgi:hypothetical protein